MTINDFSSRPDFLAGGEHQAGGLLGGSQGEEAASLDRLANELHAELTALVAGKGPLTRGSFPGQALSYEELRLLGAAPQMAPSAGPAGASRSAGNTQQAAPPPTGVPDASRTAGTAQQVAPPAGTTDAARSAGPARQTAQPPPGVADAYRLASSVLQMALSPAGPAEASRTTGNTQQMAQQPTGIADAYRLASSALQMALSPAGPPDAVSSAGDEQQTAAPPTGLPDAYRSSGNAPQTAPPPTVPTDAYSSLGSASQTVPPPTGLPDVYRPSGNELQMAAPATGLPDAYRPSGNEQQMAAPPANTEDASRSGGEALTFAGRRPQLYFLPEEQRAAPTASPSAYAFDAYTVRRDFPLLEQRVHGKPLIWLDNAATTQKPRQVIEALNHFYRESNSNVHRGAHQLATRATDLYEGAREKVQRFLGAQSPREIVFVRGTTEGINLVAQTYGRKFLQAGDEIILTTLEHHANIVPWQMLCQEKGTHLRVVPLNERGEVQLASYEQLLGPRTRLVALSQVSNVLGTVVPVREMTAMAHSYGARVLIDGAQAVPHLRANVQEMDADFYVFSGHKLFAPTGIGVLYGKRALLEEMPPWQGGGNMINTVTFEHTTYNQVPQKFEAGTGHIAGAVGLGAALDYLEQIGFEAAYLYERALTGYAMQALESIPGLRLIGTSPHKVSVLSFVTEAKSAQEVGRFLDQEGIAVRAGHHCAQPALRWFGLQETVRPSLALYNTKEDVDALISALLKCQRQHGKN